MSPFAAQLVLSATLPEASLKSLLFKTFQITLRKSEVLAYPVARANTTLLAIETIRAFAGRKGAGVSCRLLMLQCLPGEYGAGLETPCGDKTMRLLCDAARGHRGPSSWGIDPTGRIVVFSTNNARLVSCDERRVFAFGLNPLSPVNLILCLASRLKTMLTRRLLLDHDPPVRVHPNTITHFNSGVHDEGDHSKEWVLRELRDPTSLVRVVLATSALSMGVDFRGYTVAIVLETPVRQTFVVVARSVLHGTLTRCGYAVLTAARRGLLAANWPRRARWRTVLWHFVL